MAKLDRAIFAAGCFWGVQQYFDQIPGVAKTTVGYSGGQAANPTYWQVASQKTGHAESILVEYDPRKVSYETLARHFFRLHDPTQYMRQGPDVGPEYRSAIFYTSNEQKRLAEQLVRKLQKNYNDPIVTEIKPAGEFYEAEEEHQKFVEKTGFGACHVAYAPLAQEKGL